MITSLSLADILTRVLVVMTVVYGGALHNTCCLTTGTFCCHDVYSVPASCLCWATVQTQGCIVHTEQMGATQKVLTVQLLSGTKKIFELKKIYYRFSIFQPADLRFWFTFGYAWHGEAAIDIFLCATNVLHPLRKGCKWQKTKIQRFRRVSENYFLSKTINLTAS